MFPSVGERERSEPVFIFATRFHWNCHLRCVPDSMGPVPDETFSPPAYGGVDEDSLSVHLKLALRYRYPICYLNIRGLKGATTYIVKST
jgi:hypothetical protein